VLKTKLIALCAMFTLIPFAPAGAKDKPKPPSKPAPKPAPKQEAKIEGVITAVSTSPATITVSDSAGRTVTLNVASGTDIEGGNAASLVVGARVEAKYDLTSLTATKIELEGRDDDDDDEAEIKGTVTAVSSSPSMVSITSGGRTVTLNLSAATRFERGTAANLVVGSVVEAEYHPTTLNALKIKFEDGPRQQVAEVKGTVTAVSGAQVTIANGDRSVTLNVTPATQFENGAAANLVVGAAVEARFDAATLNALRIQFKTQASAVGQILSADAATGQFVVRMTAPGGATTDLTLTTSAATRVKVGGAELSAADLPLLVGAVARVEYNTVTRAVQSVTVEAVATLVAEGQVTAVETVGRTLTVQTAGGPVTVVVPAGAEIRLREARASLDKVVVGDFVRVLYVPGAARNLALRIDVATPKPQSFMGSVVAVDAAAGTLTVLDRRGQVIVTVDAKTDLRINGKRATLAQLASTLTTSRSVKISGKYVARGTQNLATELRVTAQSNNRGRGRGGDD